MQPSKRWHRRKRNSRETMLCQERVSLLPVNVVVATGLKSRAPAETLDGASALDFQVFRRALATIGNLLILDRLPLVEAGESGVLHCGDMNENVFAPRRGLNESVALGRVEPLVGTFSHTLPPRDLIRVEQAVPAGRVARTNKIRRLRWAG